MFFRLFLLISIASTIFAFDCESRKDGMYPSDSNGCTDVFWKCWAGTAFRFTCPSDLFYRVDAEYCDHKEKVPNCQEKKIGKGDETEKFNCSNKNDGYHMKQVCKNHLYYCESGKPTKKSMSTHSFY